MAKDRSDEAQDKAMIGKGVHQHEGAMHKGMKKTKMKLKSGGAVAGDAPAARMDKRARGGRMTPKSPLSGADVKRMPYEKGRD